MKLIVLGVDGLDLGIIHQYGDELPNFKKLNKEGILEKMDSVFPADSVPAWNTIFTGLTPGEHGIIRGKDFIESVEEFNSNENFTLEGNTFWDALGKHKLRSLVVNPFIAYPPWPIHGTMISGPAFVKGDTLATPADVVISYPEAHGGYKAVQKLSELRREMEMASSDTTDVWNEFFEKWTTGEYDLGFVTFSTLDRIQHNTWRFFDEKDPLYKFEPYFSNCILSCLKQCDEYIGIVLERLSPEDALMVISDHGFGQRPYTLINLNEALRQAGLLKLYSSGSDLGRLTSGFRYLFECFKNGVLHFLAKIHMIDIVVDVIKYFKFLKKYKKSTSLIDIEQSVCYVDDLFSGKKPYCGLCFGEKIKCGGASAMEQAFNQVVKFFENSDLPKPLWIKRGSALYPGIYSDNVPDICLEFPKEFGVEFELFGDIRTNSVTHYKMSGGHLGKGTYGFFSKSAPTPSVHSIQQIHDAVLDFFKESR